jgi:TolA-binding protein
MKTLILRTIVVALLALFAWLAWQEQGKPERPAPSQVSLVNEQNADGETAAPAAQPPGGYRNGIILFTYIVFIAITAGTIVLKWVLPALGDRIGDTFYSAPGREEQTPTQKAMALVAQGEYHKALAAFGKIMQETPGDRFAVMESAKIYQDKLGDTDAAVQVLEQAVAGEWPEDDKCFFLLKLADIHSTERGDFGRARELLNQLITSHPGSHQAANAHHKLNEIEEQEFMARRQ